jgi:hypothetical protein
MKMEKATYAALSYCWGREQLFKATIRTMLQLLTGINEQHLLPTLRDAVLVTETLGLQYL